MLLEDCFNRSCKETTIISVVENPVCEIRSCYINVNELEKRSYTLNS